MVKIHSQDVKRKILRGILRFAMHGARMFDFDTSNLYNTYKA
nr:hypothetical protein [uncultured Campylobacter sp.]